MLTFWRTLFIQVNLFQKPSFLHQLTHSMTSRLSKIFETFNIWSDLNFSNTQNSRSEHIWTLNFSIWFASLRTSNIKVPNQHGMNKKLDNLILTAFLIWFYDANAILLLFWSRKPFRNIFILFELRCLYCKNCLHHHNSRKHEWTYNSGSWNLKSPFEFISSWIVMFLLENLNEIMNELIQ